MRIAQLNKVLPALNHMSEKEQTLMAMTIVYWRIKSYESAQNVITELQKQPNLSSRTKQRIAQVQKRIDIETGKVVEPERARSKSKTKSQPKIPVGVPPIRMPKIDK